MSSANQTPFQETMAQAARGAAAAVHKFRLIASEHGGVHVFVEGQNDRPYYEPKIRHRLGSSTLTFHIADGRSEVLRCLELIEPIKDLAEGTLFIVDSDFHPLIHPDQNLDERVFATCFYSVESYFVATETLQCVFCTHGNLDWNERFCEETKNSFNALLSSASRVMRFLMAICITCRENNLTANLGNVKLNSVLEIDESGGIRIKPNGRREFIARAQIDLAQVDYESVRKWYHQLAKIPVHQWLRGKYFIWIMAKFLSLRGAKLAAQKRANAQLFRHARPRQNLSADELITVAAASLNCPEQLGEYLRKYLP